MHTDGFFPRTNAVCGEEFIAVLKFNARRYLARRLRYGLVGRGCSVVAALIAVLWCTGCATIVSSSTYPVAFSTEPAGAQIEVKDNSGMLRFAGTTPATFELPAGDGYFSRARYTVAVKKEGHAPTSVVLRSRIDPWYWGNFVIGGLIGFLLVDPLSGAMWRLDGLGHTLNLTPDKAPQTVAIQQAQAPLSPQTSLEPDLERLRQLSELTRQGVLTQVEFESKKRAILNGMK
jgi:hypothetical protein